MAHNTWQLQEAKARLSELVDRVLSQGVQVITRRGKKAVVLLPYDEYQRLTRQSDGLAAFLLDSPLADSDLQIERSREQPREIGLEP